VSRIIGDPNQPVTLSLRALQESDFALPDLWNEPFRVLLSNDARLAADLARLETAQGGTTLALHRQASVLDHPNGSVTAPKIAPGAVTAEKIAPGAVTAEKIAPGAVTAEKIAVGYSFFVLSEGQVERSGISVGSSVRPSVAVYRLGELVIFTLRDDSEYKGEGTIRYTIPRPPFPFTGNPLRNLTISSTVLATRASIYHDNAYILHDVYENINNLQITMYRSRFTDDDEWNGLQIIGVCML